ncbi:MAG: hypothetical protein ABEK17_00700 [Candidatus Aenigmatarchaeota archaeon]
MSEREEKKVKKKMDEEALEDMKPVKGSPNSLTDDKPEIEDVVKKAKKEED